MSKICGYTTIVAAQVIGGMSLLLFCIFLFLGPFQVVDLNMSTAGALGLNGALCLGFFLQHSFMVRKSFRRQLGVIVPDVYHGAIYSIVSGAALMALVLFWQSTDVILASAGIPLRYLLRGAYLATILGFLWGMQSLGSFDAFGIQPIRAKISGITPKAVPLTIRGPYRWVRHPLYALFLVMLWSYPHLTADRLLLNASWTIWIFVGSMLEERDLVSEFGESYRQYQQQVPMLLPTRIPR